MSRGEHPARHSSLYRSLPLRYSPFSLVNKPLSTSTLFSKSAKHLTNGEPLYIVRLALAMNDLYTLKYLIAVPPANQFLEIFPAPRSCQEPPGISFCIKISQNMLHTDYLKKSFSLSVIFLCCLHSHNHRRLIYEHRVLHSSIILDFIAVFTPPSIFRSPRQLGTKEYTRVMFVEQILSLGDWSLSAYRESSKMVYCTCTLYFYTFLSSGVSVF